MRDKSQIIYWVCTEGIIWSLYPATRRTNYPASGCSVVFRPRKSCVEIITPSGETAGEYQAWTSLIDLAYAIEDPT